MLSRFAGCTERMKPVDVCWGARSAAQRSGAGRQRGAKVGLKLAHRPAEEGVPLSFIHARRGGQCGDKNFNPVNCGSVQRWWRSGRWEGVLLRLRLRVDFPDRRSTLSGAHTVSFAVDYIYP